MQLVRIRARGYRSLADFDLDVLPLNVLIGANAAGKSNVLDLLRFLGQGVATGDFADALRQRGGFLHLAWKGDVAREISIETHYRDGDVAWVWKLTFRSARADALSIDESLTRQESGAAPTMRLQARGGEGWWWASDSHEQIGLAVASTACALAAASAATAFEGRPLASFVRRWTFFDPQPGALRRAAAIDGADTLDAEGANLASRLFQLQKEDSSRYERIVDLTRSILGVPRRLEFRMSEDSGRVFFVQHEDGLRFPVHQLGSSSGTLRMLALITALIGSGPPGLVGIEEPENHLHPNAIDGFVQVLVEASRTHQILVTTHWPRLLDGLEDPTGVCVIRRDAEGSHAERHDDPERMASALAESGLGLGEFFESTGFGS